MLLRETGFTFGGLHSRSDMGMQYAEKDGHTITPRIRRNSYEIAGVSGTVLFDGETRDTIPFEGTLFPAAEPETQAEAQQLLRRVGAWLTDGRQKLIFDYEPGVYYLAELSAETKWSLKNWFGGELSIRFEAQPYAYSVQESSATGNITGTTFSHTFTLQTGEPAPISLQVLNTGTAPITGVQIGDKVKLENMNVATNKAIVINLEPPIRATAGGQNALPYATRFSPILLSGGRQETVTVTLSYGTGNRGAQVRISARGRW